MKTTRYDAINNRTIERDFENETLTIIGDFSSSSITSYWIVNKANLAIPLGIYITKEGAEIRKNYLNARHATNTFIIISRTIFV